MCMFNAMWTYVKVEELLVIKKLEIVEKSYAQPLWISMWITFEITKKECALMFYI